MVPTLTFRQIYSAENIYLHTYQHIGLEGVTGGALVSKSVNMTKSSVYSTSMRTNFSDFNFSNKLKVGLNDNVSVIFKMVVENHF
jgi:hypothetical protein